MGMYVQAKNPQDQQKIQTMLNVLEKQQHDILRERASELAARAAKAKDYQLHGFTPGDYPVYLDATEHRLKVVRPSDGQEEPYSRKKHGAILTTNAIDPNRKGKGGSGGSGGSGGNDEGEYDGYATKRYIASQNSPQQTKLRQSMQTLAETMPLLEQAAQDVGLGNNPLLNKAELLAGQHLGPLVPENFRKAVGRYNVLASTGLESLGSIMTGGNAVTGEALKVAADALPRGLGGQALRGATEGVRQEMEARLQAMGALPPAGLSKPKAQSRKASSMNAANYLKLKGLN